jgi:hypothetical protein
MTGWSLVRSVDGVARERYGRSLILSYDVACVMFTREILAYLVPGRFLNFRPHFFARMDAICRFSLQKRSDHVQHR